MLEKEAVSEEALVISEMKRVLCNIVFDKYGALVSDITRSKVDKVTVHDIEDIFKLDSILDIYCGGIKAGEKEGKEYTT
ncbi:MAG: hypothetical protein V3V33_12525 [Candidatus Lokiarchaeia archaeon]